MTQIALLGDPHMGIKNDSEAFLNYYREFYENIFFPALSERGIKNVIILGDTFDKRKNTNHSTLQAAKSMLFDRLQNLNIDTTIIVGNHDSYHKNTLAPNSVRLLFGEYSNTTIISSPYTMGNKLFLPWICEQNYEESMKAIKNSKAKYCFAHLELSGFLNNSYVMKEGLSASLFKKFSAVYSGHYHNHQIIDNITYTGTPYEMTWADSGDIKGFHILDDETGELEFIKNPIKMFHTLTYNEDVKNIIPDVGGKIVKVIVENVQKRKLFDAYIEKISEMNPFELKIVENLIEHDSLAEDVDLDVDSTSDIIEKYIAECEISLDNVRLKEMFKELYAEAVLL